MILTSLVCVLSVLRRLTRQLEGLSDSVIGIKTINSNTLLSPLRTRPLKSSSCKVTMHVRAHTHTTLSHMEANHPIDTATLLER